MALGCHSADSLVSSHGSGRNFMKVLAGVNGTQLSCDALRFASRMLSPDTDSFVFYYAPQHVTVEHSDRILPSVPMEIRQALVESVFSLSREALPEGFRGSTLTVLGEKKASEGLLLAADQQKADLILVGADDKGRFPFYLGRVAKAVSRSSEVPVLVYRKSEWETMPPDARDAGSRRRRKRDLRR